MVEDRLKELDSDSAPVLKNSIVTVTTAERFVIRTLEGRPATVAIVDEHGHVLDSGPLVEQELHDLAVLSYRAYLKGEGYLRITSTPTGLFEE